MEIKGNVLLKMKDGLPGSDTSNLSHIVDVPGTVVNSLFLQLGTISSIMHFSN